MKIISGSARGMNLKSPRGKKIRPTSQKVKGAFFNIVHDNIHEADFLDLFSGSGGMGLEALSRGAKKCIFVDKDKDSARLIRENIRLAKMQGKAIVYQGDVQRVLYSLFKKERGFNIIYIDPPYEYKKITEILLLLRETGLLIKGGIIGVERPSRDDLKWSNFSPFPLQQKKVYGETALYLLGSRE